MKLGIFGGTFDPPHLGHLILAAEARHQLGLGRVLWVLTPNPPHKNKQPVTPSPYREALLRAALAERAEFEFSRVDLERPFPHYAVDTVRILKEKHPSDKLIYLMGGDSLRDLPTWHTPQEFVTVCDGIGVMHRPGDHIRMAGLEMTLPGITVKVSFVEAPLLEISSTDIRQRVAENRPYRDFLPAEVFELVEQYRLYRYT